MKKTRLLSLLFVLALTCGILLATVPLQADAETYDDFTYTVQNDEVTITGYTGDGGNVVIPDTIDGYPVTVIGYKAFATCISLESIVIPEGAKTISDYAFQGCASLKSVTLPDSITSIGRYSFTSCSSLESIVIPSGVRSILTHAFSSCSSLKSIVIPEKVTKIENYAFYYCRSLESITLSDSVTSIGKQVFQYCESLSSIRFPAGVTNIPENVFLGCYALETITVDEKNPVYYSSGNCVIEKESKKLVAGCAGSVIPNEVTSIGDYAFNTTNITKVIIPEGVTSIGQSAFNNCKSLKSVYIPESVTTVGYRAFSYCTRMTDIYCEAEELPSGWDADWIYTQNSATVHWGCDCSHGQRKENIIKEATKFEDGELEYTCLLCGENGTETFFAPEIDRGYCGYVKNRIMWTFDASTGTLTLSGKGGTERYNTGATPDWTVYRSKITSLVIEEGITGIGDYAFRDCYALQTVVFPDSLGEIRTYAFQNTGLTSVTLSKNIYHIGDNAFASCDDLAVVYLHQTGGQMWRNVFDGCDALTDIYCAAEEFPTNWYAIWLGDCTATVHWGYKAKENDLKFTGASLTLQESLTINFKIDAALFGEGGYGAPYVKFVLNGVETVVTSYSILNDRYVFDFKGLLPNQMNQTIYATVCATYDGVLYESEAHEYSIATYCYNTLEKYGDDSYAQLRTLLVDLLNYGAAVQRYTSDQYELVNAKLTDAQKAWGTNIDRTYQSVQDTAYSKIDSPLATWKSGGLNLTEEIGVRLGFEVANIEGLSVEIKCGGYEQVIPSSQFVESNGRQYIFVMLTAPYMSEPIYATVYDGEVAVSNTMRYSVESYACNNIDSSALTELLRAMMNYGDSAYAYTH